ncbi:MAG: hypothetical protein KA757_13265 [Vogesella sp.]|nr:hypothetical protein [Vogesella sp.]
MSIECTDIDAIVRSALSAAGVEHRSFLAGDRSYVDLPCRFPISVSPKSRLFLQVYSDSLGVSLSELCALIINQTVTSTISKEVY